MKKTSFHFAAILFMLVITAPLAQANQADIGAPALDELKNATYAGIEDGPVSLSNGHWEGAPYVENGASRPSVGLIEGAYYSGDLDGDSQPEAVVMLWQNSGGSGENTYVMVMSRKKGEIKNIGSALIGDRVKLRSGNIIDGNIVLEVLQAGEDDAMCCPTQLATRTWSLQNGQLLEGDIQVTGKLSLALLDGTEWVLNNMSLNPATADGPEVTLAFVDDRIAGKSACNRYSASIQAGDNTGDIKIGPAMGTMMACPDELMRVEREYLGTLPYVSSFSFQAGSLALNGQKEDGTLIHLLFSKINEEIPGKPE